MPVYTTLEQSQRLAKIEKFEDVDPDALYANGIFYTFEDYEYSKNDLRLGAYRLDTLLEQLPKWVFAFPLSVPN